MQDSNPGRPEAHTSHHEIAEVAGAPFTPLQVSAAIAAGVIALISSGLPGLLFSALGDEHRLTEAGFGQAAMLEALTTGFTAMAAGVWLRPRHLRLIAGVAGLAMAGLNLAILPASGLSVLILRALIGVPIGLVLWLASAMIARTATPERWAAFMFLGIGLAQFLVAASLSAFILPRFGANGAFMVMAAATATCALAAPMMADSYGDLPGLGTHASGLPPPRGWLALGAVVALTACVAAVAVYLVPLAREAGLTTNAARLALSVGTGCQVLGGAVAILVAGRLRHVTIFWICAALFALAWASYALHPPGWWFIFVCGASGIATALIGPFFVPMTVEADPSRRSAVQAGAAQLLAGCLGPFLASLLANDHDNRAVLALAGALLAIGLGTVAYLHRTSSPSLTA